MKLADLTDHILSVADVADELDITPQAALQRINRAEIPTHRIGRSIVIKRDHLKLIKSNRKKGRPKKAEKVEIER